MLERTELIEVHFRSDSKMIQSVLQKIGRTKILEVTKCFCEISHLPSVVHNKVWPNTGFTNLIDSGEATGGG